MALHGDLGDFALADVFRLVTLSGRTGVLRLHREGASGTVWFRGGDVFFATSDRRGGLLGERLAAAGRVTPAQLTRALEAMEEEPEGGRRLGELMIDLGLIDQTTLEDFVREQIQDTIFDLFLWEEGSFEFELLTAPPQGQDIGLAVSVENIIMESARRLSEATSLRKQDPSAGIVYRMASMPGEEGVEISLTPAEWRVITLTDGTRTVSDIAQAAEQPVADVARTLHGLRGAGLLDLVEPEEASVPDAERDAGLAMMADIASMPPAPAEPEPEERPVFEIEPEIEPEPEPEPESARAPEPTPTPEPAPESAPESAVQPAAEVPGVDDYYGAHNLSERFVVEDSRMGESAWAAIGDELTALTGGVSSRKARASARPVPETPKEIHRDPRIGRATIEAVIEGLERL